MARIAGKSNGKRRGKEKVRLGKHLVLNSYLLDLFGMTRIEEMQALLKDQKDGFNEEGQSYVHNVLAGLKGLKVPLDKLEQYDGNIRGYLEHMNQRRRKPIDLMYFQYIAVLFTEMYLDRFFSDPKQLMRNLNARPEIRKDPKYRFAYGIHDLNKLAFWMATGSGKTLIMHINYLQFMIYNIGPHAIEFDNILLITPSEMLTKQHLDEMSQSSIPCDEFSRSVGGLFEVRENRNKVRVTDIHKLTEEKKGQGVTVDIEEFGKRNLVFVDEGHKGSGGKKWKRFREFVAREGFTFEYSATFGQAVASMSGANNELLVEYGKSVIMDYSYRFFHRDGFGKDYRILNLREKNYDSINDTLLLANLLTYYEQKLLFGKYPETVKEYNIENPLWIFVGGRVQGKKEQSDIRTVIEFLTRVLRNEENWIVDTIGKILLGNSGLLDSENQDLFSQSYPEQKLRFLRESGSSPDTIFRDILKTVFLVNSSVPLYLVDLRKAPGEIALKAGSSEFFGVINIGDDTGFLKSIREDTDIPVAKDEMTTSLFDKINERDSRITMLLGAKKFIEGWNCWRVSNMGLLNIGKSEGSQIIQLFGRGVRLRGKNFCLKRSSAIDDTPPDFLRTLETLNIFGIQANYMEQFRDHLDAEGIDLGDYRPIKLPIKINKEFLAKNLLIPHFPESGFSEEQFLRLSAEEKVNVQLNLIPKVDIISSLQEGGIRDSLNIHPRTIANKYLDLVDWSHVYFELMEYKQQQKWTNIIFNTNVLKSIIEGNNYELYCPEGLVNPSKFEDLHLLEEIVVSILKKYLKSFYSRKKNLWMRKNIKIVKLDSEHGNLTFKEYNLKVEKKEFDYIVQEEKIPYRTDAEWETLIPKDEEKMLVGNRIKRMRFDRHLYQPLLLKPVDIETHPEGLNSGETEFIKDLNYYYTTNQQKFSDTDLFVLRNLPRKGIGFFDSAYFYPDFIIWMKKGEMQHLIFVDPKGLVHAFDALNEEKIRLHKDIKDLEQDVRIKLGIDNITMDSFIISVTPYKDIRSNFHLLPKNELESHHILFQHDDKDHYIEKLFKSSLAS